MPCLTAGGAKTCSTDPRWRRQRHTISATREVDPRRSHNGRCLRIALAARTLGVSANCRAVETSSFEPTMASMVHGQRDRPIVSRESLLG
jgi:hypothetical protein